MMLSFYHGLRLGTDKDSSRVFNARREPQLTLAATAIFK